MNADTTLRPGEDVTGTVAHALGSAELVGYRRGWADSHARWRAWADHREAYSAELVAQMERAADEDRQARRLAVAAGVDALLSLLGADEDQLRRALRTAPNTYAVRVLHDALTNAPKEHRP